MCAKGAVGADGAPLFCHRPRPMPSCDEKSQLL